LDRRLTELEVRRGFTIFQLMTISEEAYHSLIIVEHDPMLYEDAAEMVEFTHALGDVSKDAAVLLYSPALDSFLEDLMRNSDRAFYFDKGPRAAPRMAAKTLPKTKRDQTTREVFS